MRIFGININRNRAHTPTEDERKESNKVKLLNNEIKFLNEILDKRNDEIRHLYSEKKDSNMWGAINKFVDNMGNTVDVNHPQKPDKRTGAIAQIKQRLNEMSPHEIQTLVDDKAKLQNLMSFAKANGLSDEDISELQLYAKEKMANSPLIEVDNDQN